MSTKLYLFKPGKNEKCQYFQYGWRGKVIIIISLSLLYFIMLHAAFELQAYLK